MPPDPLLAQLAPQIAGELYADRLMRALYATDASPYQIEPQLVVVPRTEADVHAALRFARAQRLPITARGGATSLAGQTVGAGMQLDVSKYLNRIIELNVAERWVRVQPGIVLDHLNGALALHGLKFAPDVSPGNRATVGGMIANNSSGVYSLRYGTTLAHVLELRVLLSDGSEVMLRDLQPAELAAKLARPDLEGACYRAVHTLATTHRDEIVRRYPRVLRRVGGYNLDAFVGDQRWTADDQQRTAGDDRSLLLQHDAPANHEPQFVAHHPSSAVHGPSSAVHHPSSPFNLSRMIVGSEGTLALILEAKLRLVERPAATGLALLEFADLFDALDAVVPCLECAPVAVELMDDLLIDLTRRSLHYKHYLDILQTPAAALLLVEFYGADNADVAAQIARLLAHDGVASRIVAATRAITPQEQTPVWLVRKAGLPLLQSMSPRRKPETVVEDSAVPPEHLSAYTRRFKALIEQHGTIAAFYGHASVGLLHVRPLLDYHDPADIAKMRALSEGLRDLVLEYGGSVSGEHGDGLLRSEHLPRVYGPTLYQAFRTIKHAFDPDGILNPGKIVDAPPLDHHLRYVPPRGTPATIRTHFGFRDTGGMLGAAELCNGNGACRKTTSGTMCPSYMATRDEQHSTRGRANALRLALGGVLPEAELWGDAMHDALDLCLACKGCTAECPSGVNLTRLKSEWLQQRHDRLGTPLRARVFGHIRTLNALGAAVAPVANAALRLPGAGIVAEALLGISRHRALPPFARQTFLAWFNQHHSQRIPDLHSPIPNSQSVLLFPDTWTIYNEPEIGIAAVRLLERLGYHVILPARSMCCGRPLLSKGLVRSAQRLLRQQLDWLAPYAAHGLPIIGLEPSCILTFRDELPDLIDDPRTQALASHSLLLDEFLDRELRRGAIDPTMLNPQANTTPALLHGHCHQKALSSTAPTLAVLRAAGYDSREIDSGCCGMAGSFGYEAEHYTISQQIGERVLLPAVRAVPPATVIIADGTSCRHQLADFAGRAALHLAEALWTRMEEQQSSTETRGLNR
jgi:FAD/FMN-containing dehydrogenase/Fe-S oxidoreductase